MIFLDLHLLSVKSMITRVLEESIRNKLGQDKAIVIMGARQVR